MNSEIILEINGYRRDILRYNYRFSRNTDLKGRPTTGVLDGSIYIEMESDGDSSILDMMLVDMNKPRPSFFFRAEPAVVSGRIRHTKDEMMLRELVFDEAYISCYGETMNATGSSPMITHFLISPTRLDINRTIRLDRRIKTTYGFWWEEYVEEEKTKVVIVNKDKQPISIVDAYWIDDNGTEQRESFPDVSFTLYVQVKNPVVGKNIDLNFKFEESGVYKCTKYSGIINADGIIILDNFKFETKKK